MFLPEVCRLTAGYRHVEPIPSSPAASVALHGEPQRTKLTQN